MKQKIKLGILDQSIVRQGSSASDAIKETIDTVKLAEELGYHRFWISEHHNAASIAGSTPEVLMVKLADVTNKIRIGSGGIMLPNHSVLCGETEEEARKMRKLMDYRLLQFEKGNFEKPGSYESIKDYTFSDTELARISYNSGRVVSGTKEQVKEQLTRLANDFGIDEIIAATMTDSLANRKRSFELLAEAFGLKKEQTITRQFINR